MFSVRRIATDFIRRLTSFPKNSQVAAPTPSVPLVIIPIAFETFSNPGNLPIIRQQMEVMGDFIEDLIENEVSKQTGPTKLVFTMQSGNYNCFMQLQQALSQAASEQMKNQQKSSLIHVIEFGTGFEKPPLHVKNGMIKLQKELSKFDIEVRMPDFVSSKNQSQKTTQSPPVPGNHRIIAHPSN